MHNEDILHTIYRVSWELTNDVSIDGSLNRDVDYYTQSIILTRKSQAMAMAPMEPTQVHEYSKGMTINIMILLFQSINWLILTTDKNLL